ncbi:hypothetical protein EYF80_010678 [Liparis tanakae]|uniref:Uncharacterized protein n=1 Tax=Liparis tanakae TaxID=230148 RepID=A0A4Z2ILU2_9TELE|nr:hypothetical protein EYF80_010678 [Liparis tanakae]
MNSRNWVGEDSHPATGEEAKNGEEGAGEVEKERCSGEEAGDMRGLVCRRHRSSSLLRLRRFFSVLSFSTESWRLAFSSDSCLQRRNRNLDLLLEEHVLMGLRVKHNHDVIFILRTHTPGQVCVLCQLFSYHFLQIRDLLLLLVDLLVLHFHHFLQALEILFNVLVLRLRRVTLPEHVLHSSQLRLLLLLQLLQLSLERLLQRRLLPMEPLPLRRIERCSRSRTQSAGGNRRSDTLNSGGPSSLWLPVLLEDQEALLLFLLQPQGGHGARGSQGR